MAEDQGDRIDFSALDPTEDRARFDQIVGEIARRAAPELVARRTRASVLAQLQLWKRPVLAAAAVFALACVGVLARVRGPEQQETGDSIAEAMGMPTEVVQWLQSDEPPAVAALLVGLEETP